MDVRIDRCRPGEIRDVVGFIREHWKTDHVLTKSEPLLDWQHADPDRRGYSFIVARRHHDDQVLGILGYVSTQRFDGALGANNVIWLTTWRVRDDAGIAGLGLLLLQHLAKIERHVAIGAIGLNPATIPIYRGLGYHVDELQHYVSVNPDVAPELAQLKAVSTSRPAAGPPPRVQRLTRDGDFRPFAAALVDHRVPYKTAEYFRMRYTRHPIYEYVVLGLWDGGETAGLMAARIAVHAGKRALRLVDYLGSEELLARTGPVVQTLLEEVGAEYADIYNVGIASATFERAGFRHIDPDGPEIVPDHFEPFERRNIRLWYSLKGPRSHVLFKGDADQDRPNQVSTST